MNTTKPTEKLATRICTMKQFHEADAEKTKAIRAAIPENHRELVNLVGIKSYLKLMNDEASD